MINIAICDDENIMCSMIEENIEEYTLKSGISIDVEIYNSGEALIEDITKNNIYDLIFLDIELGGISGVDVGRTIRESLKNYTIKLAYITSVDGYEKDLLNIQPFRFIKKPVTSKKIEECLDILIEVLNIEKHFFVYKTNQILKKVYFKDVLYFESFGKKIEITTVNGKEIFYDTMDAIKERLSVDFLKPHRSYLVNYDHIDSISENIIVMDNGDKIPVSRRQLKEIKNFIIERESKSWE